MAEIYFSFPHIYPIFITTG